MITQELILYIQSQLKNGLPQDIITEILYTRGGWRSEDIAEAFETIRALEHKHEEHIHTENLPVPQRTLLTALPKEEIAHPETPGIVYFDEN